MSISIVSVPSSPPQASSVNSTGSGDASAAGQQDFVSLLFGQLLVGAAGTPPLPAAIEQGAGEKAADNTEEGTEESDASALLASLTMVSQNMRNDTIPAVTPPVVQQAADNGIPADKASATHPSLPDHSLADSSDKTFAARTDTQAAGNLPSGEITQAASDPKAAKFAVPATALPAELDTSEPKSSATPAANAPVSPSAALPLTSAAVPAMRESQAALAIPTNFHDQRWNTDFSQKIVWLASHQKQSAELTLNPPHLGNIEVSVRIDSTTNTATASFVSAHADVRESIESALPRLREMFAHAGISLGQTNVSAESFRQAGSQWNGMNNPSHGRDDNAILEPDSLAPRVGQVLTGQGNGLVDTFV